MGSLAVDWKVPSVPMASIRAHFYVTPNVPGHIPPKIAFDLIALIDELANLDDIVIGKIVAL
jgi:hypothetical protein